MMTTSNTSTNYIQFLDRPYEGHHPKPNWTNRDEVLDTLSGVINCGVIHLGPTTNMVLFNNQCYGKSSIDRWIKDWDRRNKVWIECGLTSPRHWRKNNRLVDPRTGEDHRYDYALTHPYKNVMTRAQWKEVLTGHIHILPH